MIRGPRHGRQTGGVAAATEDTRVISEEELVFEYMIAATGSGHAAPTSGGFAFFGFKGKTATR